MSEILLQCKDVKKTYRVSAEDVEVLKGVDLELRGGEMCFILGRSGSGKSTLLHILGGLDRPNGGKIYLEGTDINNLREKEKAEFRNKKIGFVFQFYHLLPELTVWENVILPGLIARKKDFKNVDTLLSIVGLTERKKHLPSQLSGGELQRAALARALVNDPDIVFCDEPTGNLDEENARIIYDLMVTLNKEKKQTFCVVTHEESFVREQQNVYRLKDGVLCDDTF
ncbi:MAG: ABC transporter ATP-binding protein [Candidatus Omnitrophica bacterium]|nr:ABC transporter ATP-binding protein [Candidatus Omnitrophota bacterium]